MDGAEEFHGEVLEISSLLLTMESNEIMRGDLCKPRGSLVASGLVWSRENIHVW